MARFMKIPQYFGQSINLLYYNPTCQYDSLEYYRKIKNVNGTKALLLDGQKDYIVAKFSSKNGWFPQIGSTFFLKFLIPENSDIFSKNFGIFGSGDTADIQLNDFWGLYVQTDPVSNTKIFYVTISNLLLTQDIPLRGFSFSPLNFPTGVFNSIALVQTSSEVVLYANGLKAAQSKLPFIPETNRSYNNIYIGRYGNTNEYNGMSVYVKEIGLWERPIDNRDILDLNDKNLVENQSVSKTSKRIKIEEGKFYYDGYIHNIGSTSLFINGVGKESVYILITEKLVTEEEDPNLLDNSSNTYNLGKPGMHRIKYEYSYASNIDTANLPEGTYAIKFLEFVDGVKTFSLLDNNTESQNDTTNTSTDIVTESAGKRYSPVQSTKNDSDNSITKYIYETMGNFIYNGLSVSMMEKDLDTYQISIGSGVYYLNGERNSIESSVYLPISRSSSITTIVNEYINVRANNPILLSQQPVAARYLNNGALISGITRAMVPVVNTKNVSVIRTDKNGEDFVDASAIKVLKVYKGDLVYTPCSSLDSDDGDYYFYNGRIKWSPSATNKPNVSQGGIAVDWYAVDYSRLYSCEEGIDKDFIVIKGDNYTKELIVYKGRGINHSLRFTPEYIVSSRIVSGQNTYIIDSSYIKLNGSTFKIDDQLDFLNVGDTIEIYYSYNSNLSVKPTWHIVFFENGNKVIDTTTDGIIDYKYYLTDVYTLTIEHNSNKNINEFVLHRGTPGYRGNAVKASIPDTALPIADILIDPDGSEYCTITPYNIYRTQVSDIRNLMSKVSDMKENIILSELEKVAEGKSDISSLKGMYVDSLTNYSRSNIVEMDAFIDLVRERLYSGFEKTTVPLNLGNDTTKAKLGREVYYPLNNFNSEIIESQKSITGSESINKLIVSEVKAQVFVYNDFSYTQELRNIYTKNALDSLGLCQLAVIPYNSETSVYNISYAGDSTSIDRTSNINRVLEKFKVFFDNTILNTVLDNRIIVLQGRGFNPNEQNIQLKINNNLIDPENINALHVNVSDPDNPKVSITENGLDKDIKVGPMSLFSGWSTDTAYGIKCNDSGEFIVSLLIPYSFNLVTGFQELVFTRYANQNEPITVKLNFNGILDSLKNVINTGSRGNISFYDNYCYSNDYIPGIIQPISKKSATLLGVNLYFEYIDFSTPMLVDIYELSGTSVNKVLTRKYIKSRSDFKNIVDNKFTIEFDNPVNIVDTKTYGIGICTENPSIKVFTTEVGKPSQSTEDYNVIVSKVKSLYSVVSANNGDYSISNDGRRGLVFDLLALDISSNPKNSYGYCENTIRFDTISFSQEQDRFSLYCDLDSTIGFDRKISIEYSTEDPSVTDNGRAWTKITPYTLVIPKDKFKFLTFRFVLSSGNKNYLPCIHQHPVVNAYKFKEISSYQTKSFESGIEDGSGENKVKIYLNAEYRQGSEYNASISPDGGLTWRNCNLVNTKINGQTSNMILQEHSYEYECRLNPPVVLAHEILPYESGSMTNGNFSAGTSIGYLVSLLDESGIALAPNELYNVDQNTGLPTTYYVTDITSDGQKVKLRIKIDSNCRGFRIYRALNGSSIYYQIYSSTALTYVPSSISSINPYKIPVSDASEFPIKGLLRINNEIIKYENIEGNNTFIVSDNGRGYLNTTISNIRPGDKVELYDYAGEHESILKGQVPRIYSDKEFFEFVDDNKTYKEYTRTAKESTFRSENNTLSYPSSLAVKISFTNDSDIIESSSIWNLICNIENN